MGCLFIYAAIPKIRQSYDFLADVYNYEMVGPTMGMVVAMVLPWVELCTGICLIGGVLVGGALLLCTCLCLLFVLAISWALVHKLHISCGCFGSSAETISSLTLIRAFVLGLVSAGLCALNVFARSWRRDAPCARDRKEVSVMGP